MYPSDEGIWNQQNFTEKNTWTVHKLILILYKSNVQRIQPIFAKIHPKFVGFSQKYLAENRNNSLKKVTDLLIYETVD